MMALWEMDAPAIIVWLLRLVVPCILFWVSFGPRIRIPWPWTGPSHSREVLLRHRQVVPKGDTPHEALATLKTVDEQTAPSLFQDRKKEREKSERRESRRDKDRDEDGESAEKRLSREERRARRSQPDSSLSAEAQEEAKEKEREREKAKKAEEAEEKRKAAEREKQMHLESLINFVAFSKYKQQRIFLFEIDGEGKPPPPPHRPPNALPPVEPPQAQCLTNAAADRANTEAQMVLKGAVSVEARRLLVTRGLFHQLTDLNVEITAPTYELMVEACIQGKDLPAASEFLMRMEGAGHAPGNELLDRVMELYLLHKKEDSLQLRNRTTPPSSKSASAPPASSAATSAAPSTAAAAPASLSNGSSSPVPPQHLPMVPNQGLTTHPAPPRGPLPPGPHGHMGMQLGPGGPQPPPPPPPPPLQDPYMPGAGNFNHAGQVMGPAHGAMPMAGPPGAPMHHHGPPGAPMHHGMVGMQPVQHPVMMHSSGPPPGVLMAQQKGGPSWTLEEQAARLQAAGPGYKADLRDLDADLPVFAIPDECSKKPTSEGKNGSSADAAGGETGSGSTAPSGLRAEAREFVPGEAAAASGSSWKPSADAEVFKPAVEFRASAMPFVPGDASAAAAAAAAAEAGDVPMTSLAPRISHPPEVKEAFRQLQQAGVIPIDDDLDATRVASAQTGTSDDRDQEQQLQ